MTRIHARLTESTTEKRNPAGQAEYGWSPAQPGQGEHHCWNLNMTGWQDDWMGDNWMAFNLKLEVHQKLGALETTAQLTRIHATDGGRH